MRIKSHGIKEAGDFIRNTGIMLSSVIFNIPFATVEYTAHLIDLHMETVRR